MIEDNLKNLLMRARSDLRTARLNARGDEYELYIAGYHIQNGIKHCIKVCLEYFKIKYPKNQILQDLNVLINLLPKEQNILSSEILDDLFNNASKLNEYEAAFVCDIDCYLSKIQVKKLLDIAQSVYSSVFDFIEGCSEEPEERKLDNVDKQSINKMNIGGDSSKVNEKINFDAMTQDEVRSFICLENIDIVEEALSKCSFACVKRTYEKYFGHPIVSTVDRSYVEAQFRYHLRQEVRVHALMKDIHDI